MSDIQIVFQITKLEKLPQTKEVKQHLIYLRSML